MWMQSTEQLAALLSKNELDWMCKPYRLADALLRVCTQLTVEVRLQGVGVYVAGEQELLGIADTTCYVREVFLRGDGVNLCFARTVMPMETYYACQDEFDTMSAKLLGKNFLYAQGERVTRGAFYYAAIAATHPYFIKCGVTTERALAARASVFCIEGCYPLLVSEVFLPKMPVYRDLKEEAV